MKNRILAIATAMAMAGSHYTFAEPSSSFSAGSTERAALENWFVDLTGVYRGGAEYWISHRTAKDAACKGSGSWLAGCQAAQQHLAGPDLRRKADADYRAGWNTAQPRVSSGIYAATQPPSGPSRASESGSPVGGTRFAWVHWLLAAAALAVMFILGRAVMALCHRRAAWSAAMAEVKAQTGRLHVRRIQLTQPDYYGTIDLAAWEKEKRAFVKTRIMPLLQRGGFSDVSARLIPRILRAIDTAAAKDTATKAISGFSNPKIFDKSMSPIDYELHCALQLQKAGWKTKSTPRSGDQGADVIAERGGVSLVAQCKLYSSSVGNGAVQEVASARQYYKTDLAVVVSNAPFTRSARQLAGVLNIRLMYHDELRLFTG